MSKLTIKCVAVNEPKGSSFFKSTDWVIRTNATVSLQNIDDRCFHDAFRQMEHYKEIKNHAGWVSNIKPFFDLFTWDIIEYPTVIDNNNCALFEKTLEIALILLYVSVHIRPVIENDENKFRIYKSIKQSHVSKHHTRGGGGVVLLLIPGNINQRRIY